MAQLTDTLVSGDERVTGMIYGTQAGNYATCSSGASAVKTVTIPGFVLTTGVHVRIKFTNTNTLAVASLTLNVSETGAKAIKVKGNNLAAAGDLAANGVYEFVYDGTNWELTGAVPTSHAHGNIANGGTLTDTAAAAAGNDYVVIRDADNAKIQTSTIKGTDVADAVSKKHSHTSITVTKTATQYDGSHTLKLPDSDPYSSARTPTSHADANGAYGKATTDNFGHVQLATGDMNGAANVDGVAVSKNHTHSQYLNIANASLEGQSTTILAQVQSLASNNIHYKRFYTSSDGGSANISDKPTGTTTAGFMLEAYCNRYASSSDWRYVVLCYVQANKPKIAWIKTSDTSISWQDLNTNTDTKVTATAKANTDNSNYKILATASASPTSGAATEAVYDTDITLNPSTNTITANVSGNAATATSANITRTADTTNGDKLQIGSGTAVNVVNSQSTLKVAASAASTNTNARHIWFSDSSTETKRAYSDDLTYRTDYNRITAHVSGYSTGLNRSNTIQHQQGGDASAFQYKVHRIATFPRSGITTQAGSADESLVLQLFTKGYNKEDYGIVLITVKLAGTVSNNPTVNVRWKLRSAAMSTDAVQAAFIKDGNGLWHVDVFFLIQHSYQLTVFNKLGSFSPADASPEGGWTLISSEYDASKTPIPTTECYTDISGTASTTASKTLYNANGYVGAATDITDDGIVGTANIAKAYDTSFSGTNSIYTALTSHTHGLQISTKRTGGANSFTVFMDNYNGTNTWLANLGLENKNSTDAEPTFWLASIRSQNCTYTPSGGTATSLPWYAGSYSPGITFGGKDTKGVISLRYDQVDNYGKMTLAAGSGKGENGAPSWWFSIRGLHNTTYILPPLVSGSTNKYAINISGTAVAADTAAEAGYATALKVTSAIGSSIKPVYIGANGIPQVIPNDSTYSDYLTLNVLNARTASEASTANKWKTGRSFTIKDDSLAHAGTSTTGVDGSGNVVLRLPTEITLTKVNATTFNGTATSANSAAKLSSTGGTDQRPVYFPSSGDNAGKPVAIATIGKPDGETYLNIKAASAYDAKFINGYSFAIGAYAGTEGVIYLD